VPDLPPVPVPRAVQQHTDLVPVAQGVVSFPDGARPKIVRAAAQGPVRGKVSDEEIDFVVNIELPGPERLFERYSERQVFERIRMDARQRPGAPAVHFPEERPVTREPYAGRRWPQTVSTVEPSYVCHGRLLFEQRNFERYGWDLGVLDPLVTAGAFYYDLALLPYHYWTDPCQRWDCSAGKCLPGDPVPLRFYREKFSLTGLAAQGFVTTGLAIVIP